MRRNALRRAAGLLPALAVTTALVVAALASDVAPRTIAGPSAAARGPLNVTITLDRSRVARATIGAAGGTVGLTTRNGTRLALRIPRGALAVDTPITMTAIRSIGKWPFRRPPVGAVQLKPYGLEIPRGATLSITPRRRVPVRSQVPFAASSDGRTGRDFHIYPSDPTRSKLVLDITHFSAYGEGEAPYSEVEPIRLPPPVKRVAKVEATAARVTQWARAKHKSLDDPRVMNRYAKALLPAYKAIAGLVASATTNDFQSYGALKEALALDSALSLLHNRTFEWAPPKTTDARLAAQLAALQQSILSNLGKVIQNAYDSAKAKCSSDAAWIAQMATVAELSGLIGAPIVQVISIEQFEADARGCTDTDKPSPIPKPCDAGNCRSASRAQRLLALRRALHASPRHAVIEVIA